MAYNWVSVLLVNRGTHFNSAGAAVLFGIGDFRFSVGTPTPGISGTTVFGNGWRTELL